MTMDAVNPEEPPELENLQGDTIGDTLFSKGWVLAILIKLVKSLENPVSTKIENENLSAKAESLLTGKSEAQENIQREDKSLEVSKDGEENKDENARKETKEESGGKEDEVALKDAEDALLRVVSDSIFTPRRIARDNDITPAGSANASPWTSTRSVESTPRSSDGGRLVRDVEDDFQTELCRLWDMSINPTMSKYLHENNSVDIFIEILCKSEYPRLTEICAGILGNMACDPETRELMTKHDEFRVLLPELLNDSDTATLIQASRALVVFLNDSKVKPVWMAMIEEKGSLQKTITFILSSSTNDELIYNTSVILDKILMFSEEICEEWSDSLLVQAVNESLRQTENIHRKTMEILISNVQQISTSKSGIQAIAAESEDVWDLILAYTVHLSHDDVIILPETISVLTAIFSVLNVCVTISLVGEDVQFIRCLLKVLVEFSPFLLTSKMNGNSGAAEATIDLSEVNPELVKLLEEVLISALCNFIKLLAQHREDFEEAGRIPESLVYLDKRCPASRVKVFIEVTKQACSTDTAAQLSELIICYNLQNIEKFIFDNSSSS